jgi:hypothetical protein
MNWIATVLGSSVKAALLALLYFLRIVLVQLATSALAQKLVKFQYGVLTCKNGEQFLMGLGDHSQRIMIVNMV